MLSLKGKGKVLVVPKHHAHGGIPLILGLSIRWRQVDSFMLWLSRPQEGNYRVESWVVRTILDVEAMKKIPVPLPRFEPQPPNPVTSLSWLLVTK
jgi:hypothetical protein